MFCTLGSEDSYLAFITGSQLCPLSEMPSNQQNGVLQSATSSLPVTLGKLFSPQTHPTVLGALLEKMGELNQILAISHLYRQWLSISRKERREGREEGEVCVGGAIENWVLFICCVFPKNELLGGFRGIWSRPWRETASRLA